MHKHTKPELKQAYLKISECFCFTRVRRISPLPQGTTRTAGGDRFTLSGDRTLRTRLKQQPAPSKNTASPPQRAAHCLACLRSARNDTCSIQLCQIPTSGKEKRSSARRKKQPRPRAVPTPARAALTGPGPAAPALPAAPGRPTELCGGRRARRLPRSQTVSAGGCRQRASLDSRRRRARRAPQPHSASASAAAVASASPRSARCPARPRPAPAVRLTLSVAGRGRGGKACPSPRGAEAGAPGRAPPVSSARRQEPAGTQRVKEPPAAPPGPAQAPRAPAGGTGAGLRGRAPSACHGEIFPTCCAAAAGPPCRLRDTAVATGWWERERPPQAVARTGRRVRIIWLQISGTSRVN